MKTKKVSVPEAFVYVGAAMFLITICILGIPCCDDLFFQVWEFASLKDMFLLHPSNSPMYSFVPQNGRYLGNILGLFLVALTGQSGELRFVLF